MRPVVKIALLSAMLFGASVKAEVVENYSGNGVNNTRSEAESNARALEKVTAIGGVNVLYNNTKSLGFDLIESMELVFNIDQFYDDDGTVNSDSKIAETLRQYRNSSERNEYMDYVVLTLAKSYVIAKVSNVGTGDPLDSIYGVCIYPGAATFCETMNRIPNRDKVIVATATVEEYKGEIFVPTTSAFDDLNDMMLQMDADNPNSSRNLLGHSEGNLFMNRLCEQMKAEGRGDKVKVFSVATPDDYVCNDGKYVTLKEDFVSLSFFGSLPRNVTNYHYLTRPFKELAYNYFKYDDDFMGHGLEKSYLHEGSESEKIIVRNYEQNYYDLKGEFNPALANEVYLKNAALSKSHVLAGESVIITVTQCYDGIVNSADLSNPRVGYYLTDSNHIYHDSVLLGENSSNLGENRRCETEVKKVNIPITTKSGYHRIGIKADRYGYIPEINNTKPNFIYLRLFVDKIDTSNDGSENNIEVVYAKLSDNIVHRGQTVRIRTKIAYQGSLSWFQVGRIYTRYYLAAGIYPGDREVIGMDYSTIGWDDRSDYEYMDYIIPFPYRSGQYYIHVETDTFDRLQEDTSDNFIAIPITIQ